MNLEAFSELAGGLDHPEGVAQGPDGRVYAGGEAGQIYRITLDGDVKELASTGGFIYGLTLDGTGNVYACDFGKAAVMRISPTGEITAYSTGTDDHPLRVPNYAAFDSEGNLYVTDSGEWGADDGCIYRIAPGGETSVWTEQTPRFPNGCCIDLNGDALLVIESRRRAISRIPIRSDGSAGSVEPIVDLTGSQPDGMALASDGSLVVGCYRPDRLYRIDAHGTVDILADDPDGVVLNQPANVAFVGLTLDRLAVSSLGGWSLMVADIGLVGAPLHHPQLD